MVWVQGPNYGGPTTAGATHGGTPYSSGNGGSTTPDGGPKGETGGTGEHKFEKKLRELEAKGEGNTAAAQVLKDYVSGIPDVRREKLGLGPSTPTTPAATPSEQQAWESMTELERIQQLASLEAGQEKYAKSWEGKEFIRVNKEKGFTEEEILGSAAWRDQFGMPSIVTTAYGGDPIMTGKRTDEYDQKISPQYIYTGLGKSLMDQYQGQTDFDYGTAKDAYWDERTAQDLAKTDQSATSYWDSGGGGGGGGTGYYGDPRRGNPVEQMANYYTPQANLQQAMINVHSTQFAKRGGIVSLLRLS